jgi:hypothetical protein
MGMILRFRFPSSLEEGREGVLDISSGYWADQITIQKLETSDWHLILLLQLQIVPDY